MRVVDVQSQEIILAMSLNELLIVNNALNEICNGIDVEEFETRVGESVDNVRLLLRAVSNAIGKVE